MATYVLAQRPDNITALLAASSILQQPVYKPLLHVPAPLPLSFGNLDQRLKHTLDGERLWLSQRKALFLFGLECDVTWVANLVVQFLECPVVQPASLFECLGDGGAPKPQLHRDVRRRDGIRGQPNCG